MSRLKKRWGRESAKARTTGGQALQSLKKGKVKQAFAKAGKAAGHLKLGLVGQSWGKKTVSQNVGSNGKLNTRNTRVVIGNKLPNSTIKVRTPTVLSQGTSRTRKLRDRSAAARKAAITRKARGNG